MDSAIFKLRFPEHSVISQPRIDLAVEESILIMGIQKGRWLNLYDIAQSYLVAHLLAIADFSEGGDSGIVAPVKLQEVDDVKISQAIADVKATDSEFLGTSYGKRYMMYRKICFAGIRGT